MKIAALVEQVGTGDAREMDALSRRAVAQGVELAAAVGDGTCTAFTVGPPEAEDVLREAVAWGRTCSVHAEGVLIDAESARADGREAVADALVGALTDEGPFDLILLGGATNGAGADDLGARLATSLGLPYASNARYLSMQGRRLHVRCERGDGFEQVVVPLPAIVSCAEGLIDPCAMPPSARALVPDERIRFVSANS